MTATDGGRLACPARAPRDGSFEPLAGYVAQRPK